MALTNVLSIMYYKLNNVYLFYVTQYYIVSKAYQTLNRLLKMIFRPIIYHFFFFERMFKNFYLH